MTITVKPCILIVCIISMHIPDMYNFTRVITLCVVLCTRHSSIYAYTYLFESVWSHFYIKIITLNLTLHYLLATQMHVVAGPFATTDGWAMCSRKWWTVEVLHPAPENNYISNQLWSNWVYYSYDDNADWKLPYTVYKVVPRQNGAQVALSDTPSTADQTVSNCFAACSNLSTQQIIWWYPYYAYISRFGPLRNQWCMRFEAKNAQIKSFVGRNFKNLPYTVATKHQRYMCMQLNSAPGVEKSNFLYKGDEVGKGMIF